MNDSAKSLKDKLIDYLMDLFKTIVVKFLDNLTIRFSKGNLTVAYN